MACIPKKKLWVYVLIIFSLFFSLVKSSSSSESPAVIDERIVEHIATKASNLYRRPISDLTAIEYAFTLSRLIDDTENKLGRSVPPLIALVCEEAAGWLSGKYGFSTKVADEPTFPAFLESLAITLHEFMKHLAKRNFFFSSFGSIPLATSALAAKAFFRAFSIESSGK